MATTQEQTPKKTSKGEPANPESSHKIDPKAPAGSENSLGQESVRDGRPNTDDSVVEAKDEEGPDITADRH
jgi:hypothetical protein